MVLAIFGSGAGGEGFFNNPLVVILAVLIFTYIFVKFCGWAKKNKLPGGVKKLVFILTGVGVVAFNILYSMGNSAITKTGDWGMATTALIAALVWVFIFAYALMTEKSE